MVVTRRIVVVLEVMWGDTRRIPYFRINPYNHSGRRLIKLIGHAGFWVTNACPQGVPTARGRSAPDAGWLAGNLARLAPALVIVCGNVARRTFRRTMAPGARVLYMPHPAARNWSHAAMRNWQRRIQRNINSL